MVEGQYPEGINEFEFRWAAKEEWSPAMSMVWKTFMAFEGKQYTKEGVKNFFEFITDDDIHNAFLGGTYKMLLALDGDRIIGVGTMRNCNRLSLLFVDEEYQNRGIGSVIIELFSRYLREVENERVFTVKAAPYAVKFYLKCGFEITGDEKEYSGIKAVPMEKRL